MSHFVDWCQNSLINLFLIFTIYIIYYLRENSVNKSTIIKSLALIIPLLISVYVSNEIFEKSKNVDRYVSIEHRVSTLNSEDASINVRLEYWKNAIKLAKTSPILGIGLGNYQVESIPYEKEISDEFVVSLHSHDDFLEITAETGIINGLIYFSLFVYLFFVNVTRIIKSEDVNTRILALLALLLLIVFGVDSLFNFPMYRPTMQIFFVLLMAFTVVNKKKKVGLETNSGIYTKINLALVIILISIPATYAAHIIYKASKLEYLIAKDDINNKNKGSMTGDEVVAEIAKFPNVLSSSEAFYEYAGIYYIRENNFEKAFKCFYKASQINPYTGRINFYKYVIAGKKGNQDSAYVYIKQAFYLRPRHSKIFQNSLIAAAKKNDTIEILKEQKIYSKYKKAPDAWSTPARVLLNTNFNRKNLGKLIDNGLKNFPKDSLLLKQKKDFLITNYIMEGQENIAKSNLAEGLKAYEKALKLDPENVYVMQNIGFYYLNLRQYKQAVPYLLNAIKKPGLYDGKTEYFIGLCYVNINDKENACKYFKISKNKNYPQALQLPKDVCE
ncbi:O-antigen ligase family protein [Flavobacterium sp. 270]|uniref:O-antigen ligase family protein n=1 Tax=Flavobacterium sp. 270 TaxID=2512114 RepID=UPI002938EF1A|nr:O-antigen ligase family protein [Flavobacterium sp. 270]